MKTSKLTINRTPQQPDGVEIDIVQPENPTEQHLLCFLLDGFLRHQVRSGRVVLDLPERFTIEYQGDGGFMVQSMPQANTSYPYYQPPATVTVLLIRQIGTRFDVIYSSRQDPLAAAAAQGAKAEPTGAQTQQLEANESTDHSLDLPPVIPQPVPETTAEPIDVDDDILDEDDSDRRRD
jgi:hypothetical protein